MDEENHDLQLKASSRRNQEIPECRHSKLAFIPEDHIRLYVLYITMNGYNYVVRMHLCRVSA